MNYPSDDQKLYLSPSKAAALARENDSIFYWAGAWKYGDQHWIPQRVVAGEDVKWRTKTHRDYVRGGYPTNWPSAGPSYYTLTLPEGWGDY